MNIRLDEVQHFGLASMLFGVSAFIGLCFWDNIAGFHVAHSRGYGWMQIVGMAGSGLYSLWAYTIHLKWKVYRQEIHSLIKGE